MPHEGFAKPVANDGPRFHSNMPVSELTEHVTRAIEASDVNSTPLVAETMDGRQSQKHADSRPNPRYAWGSRKVGLARRPNTRS